MRGDARLQATRTGVLPATTHPGPAGLRPPRPGDHKLRAFARRAIVAQPLDAGAVARDAGRYFIFPRSASTARTVAWATDPGHPCSRSRSRAAGAGMNRVRAATPMTRSRSAERRRRWARCSAPFACIPCCCSRSWWWRPRRCCSAEDGLSRPRRSCSALAFCSYVIPSLTTTFNARYAIPAGGPLTAAAAVGVWCAGRAAGVPIGRRSSHPRADAAEPQAGSRHRIIPRGSSDSQTRPGLLHHRYNENRH